MRTPELAGTSSGDPHPLSRCPSARRRRNLARRSPSGRSPEAARRRPAVFAAPAFVTRRREPSRLTI